MKFKNPRIAIFLLYVNTENTALVVFFLVQYYYFLRNYIV